MQNVVGPALVATATKSGLGVEIQSPTGLLLLCFYVFFPPKFKNVTFYVVLRLFHIRFLLEVGTMAGTCVAGDRRAGVMVRPSTIGLIAYMSHGLGHRADHV